MSSNANGGSRVEFSGRGLTSVLTTASFVVLAVSGLVMFITPSGRIANWTGWEFLGLTKAQWGALHIWYAAAFLIASAFHVYFNWRTLLSYFRNRLTHRFALRLDWVAAIVICGAIWAGTLAHVPPFSSMLALNERVKNSWDAVEERAPVPHAELLTLAELASQADVELALVLKNLENAGVANGTGETVVGDLAEASGMTPSALYSIALGTERIDRGAGRQGQRQGQGGQGHGQGQGRGGMGQKTLLQVCEEHGLGVADAIARLKAEGIEAKADMILRDIAIQYGLTPPDLVALLDGTAKQ